VQSVTLLKNKLIDTGSNSKDRLENSLFCLHYIHDESMFLMITLNIRSLANHVKSLELD
jgi:hypothetical protein